MYAFYLLVALASGLSGAFQSPTNTELSRHVGHAQATLVSFAGGTLFLIVLVALFGSGDVFAFAQVSPWKWLGGLYGVIIVAVITYGAPVLGIALTLTILMLGQLTMGLIIDTLGLLETTAIPLNPLRLAGCIVVACGILCVYRGNSAGVAGVPQKGSRVPLLVAVAFLAGMGGAVQAPTNAALARTTGSLEASLVSFTGGFLLILVFTLIVSKGKLQPMTGSPKWSWLGGLYGGFGVFATTLATPALGVGIVMATIMLGQLGGGLVIDGFGLLRSRKLHVSPWRIAGTALVLVGIVLVTAALLGA